MKTYSRKISRLLFAATRSWALISHQLSIMHAVVGGVGGDVDHVEYNPFASPRPRLLSSSPIQSSFSDTDAIIGPPTKLAPVDTGSGSVIDQDHHPLRSAGLSMSFEDFGITRPHLTRVLDTRLVDAPPVEEAETEEMEETLINASEHEKIVIVHQVSSKDSLAGVALKYGISLTELRRANHLWTSDSIHLRQVLYIPLGDPSSPVFSDSNLDGQGLNSSQEHPVPTLRPTIKRVPVSELSFFPPPSKPFLPPTPPVQPPSKPPSKPLHARYATSPAPSLNSILTALPIAASTRDTIVARLSFDSASSSYSDPDRGRDSQDNDRDDCEGHERHELDDVTIRPRPRDDASIGLSKDDILQQSSSFESGTLRRNENGYRLGLGLGPRLHRSKQPEPGSELSAMNLTSSKVLGGRGQGLHARSLSEEYTGPSEVGLTTRIRNVQLEPSPVMQIPIPSIPNARRRTKNEQEQFGTLRHGSQGTNFGLR
ncbi:hypothetical protein D9757_008230 [Collybiopsis confluens]|uniref:LysM domain-containing protein n=1 Tax=Collybiopsis confluens TaxID=2823264 RepID=A0A8H5HBG0_9AGAR|nr:hypothetical protein D9757_008230 [Collybiopsis confluens]